MISYLKGDIVLIPFPFTDLTGNKVRPAIVISNSTVNRTADLIFAQITSNIRKDDFSFLIEDSHVTKPLGESEIRCNKIFTGNRTMIKKKISSLNTDKQKELLSKIVELLN